MHYNHFRVGPPSDNYRLSISGFTGITLTDPFTTHPLNGRQFTTRDRDNDGWSDNCAVNRRGWWHDVCTHINPNYNYKYSAGLYVAGAWYKPVFVEMKIRPEL